MNELKNIERAILHTFGIIQFHTILNDYLKTKLHPLNMKRIVDRGLGTNLPITNLGKSRISTTFDKNKSIILFSCRKYDDADGGYTYIINIAVKYFYKIHVDNGSSSIKYLTYKKDLIHNLSHSIKTLKYASFSFNLSFVLMNRDEPDFKLLKNKVYSNGGTLVLDTHLANPKSNPIISIGEKMTSIDFNFFTHHSIIPINSSATSMQEVISTAIDKYIMDDVCKRANLYSDDDVFILKPTILPKNNKFHINIRDDNYKICRVVNLNAFIKDVIKEFVKINNKVYDDNLSIAHLHDNSIEKEYFFTNFDNTLPVYLKSDEKLLFDLFAEDINNYSCGINGNASYKTVEKLYERLQQESYIDFTEKYNMNVEDYLRLVKTKAQVISLEIDLIDFIEDPVDRIRTQINDPRF